MPEVISSHDGVKKWSMLLEYGLAVFLVALATVFRLLLDPYVGLTVPYVTYFLANALVIRFTRIGPSVLAILLSTLASDYYFLPPRYSFWSHPVHYLTSGVFMLANFVILALAHSMRSAKFQAEAQKKSLQAAKEDLEEHAAERNLAEQALRLSQEQYQALFDNNPLPMWVFDRDSLAYLAVNKAAIEGYGYSREEWLTMNARDIRPPEDVPRLEEHLRNLSEGAQHSGVWRHRKKDGSIIQVEITDNATIFAGRPARLILAHDITERLATEAQLHLQTSALRATANAMAITNREGTIEWVNPAFERLTGFTAAEVVGQNPRVLKAPQQQPIFYQQMWDTILKGQIWHGEVINKRKDGSLYTEEMTITPVRDGRGAITHFIAIKQDITERKRAEEAVRQSEERLRATFDHAGVGLVEVDTNDRLIAANDQVCKVLGYRCEELLGLTVHQLTYPEDRPLSDRFNAELHEGRRQRLDYEKRYRKRDGSPVWVHMTVSPIRDKQGRWLRAIATVEDISERKRAEEALKQAQERLQQHTVNLERIVEERTARLQELVGELEQFSYTLSHDLRAPLRAIQSFSELMMESGCATCTNCESKEYLQRIIAGTNRMDRLMTDALEYSRAVRTQLQLVPVDVGALLREIMQTHPNLQPAFAGINLEGTFPRVLGNETALTQCLANLLGNAVKFVPPGVKPKIRVWAENRDGQLARLWIEDNGIGIAREDQPKLFGMFQRLTAKYEGTGIGLALVRKNVQRMGGRVGVESELGQGSRFWLELKVA